jgi:hypothetical protein
VETPTMAERALKLAQGRFEVFTDIAAAAAALQVLSPAARQMQRKYLTRF